MHAEIADDVLGIDQNVEQVRPRRALIVADIAHAGLQQGLGHREDALAAEGFALAERERLHLFLEGAFHRLHLGATEATPILAPARMLPAGAVVAGAR